MNRRYIAQNNNDLLIFFITLPDVEFADFIESHFSLIIRNKTFNVSLQALILKIETRVDIQRYKPSTKYFLNLNSHSHIMIQKTIFTHPFSIYNSTKFAVNGH